MRRCPSCGAVSDHDTMPFCPACGAMFPPGDHTVHLAEARVVGVKKISGAKVFALLLGLMVAGAGIMFLAKTPFEMPADGDAPSFEYTWEDMSGNTHAVEVEYDPKDYARAVDSKIDREGSSSANRYATASGTIYAVTDYVVVDRYVRDLESQLRAKFTGAEGVYDTNRVDYANFLSTFVQKAISYELDEEAHGQDEYWVYPLQTLVLGYGDCEDTSILLAALFRAAGYDAAVVLVPSHAMAAVSLAAPPPYEHDSYAFGGKKYYMVETTLDPKPGKPGLGFPEYPVGEPEDGAMRKAIHHIFPVTGDGDYV